MNFYADNSIDLILLGAFDFTGIYKSVGVWSEIIEVVEMIWSAFNTFFEFVRIESQNRAGSFVMI